MLYAYRGYRGDPSILRTTKYGERGLRLREKGVVVRS